MFCHTTIHSDGDDDDVLTLQYDFLYVDSFAGSFVALFRIGVGVLRVSFSLHTKKGFDALFFREHRKHKISISLFDVSHLVTVSEMPENVENNNQKLLEKCPTKVYYVFHANSFSWFIINISKKMKENSSLFASHTVLIDQHYFDTE